MYSYLWFWFMHSFSFQMLQSLLWNNLYLCCYGKADLILKMSIKYEFLPDDRVRVVWYPTFTYWHKVMTSNHFSIIYWFHFMQVGEEFYFHTSYLPSQKANSYKLGRDDHVLTTFCTGWINCWFSKKQDWSGINITVVVTVTVTKCLVHILPQLWGFHLFLLTLPKQYVRVCFEGSCRTMWVILVTWSSPEISVTQQLSGILRL